MANNEVAKQEFTTNLSEQVKTITNLVTKDFANCGVQFDDYSKNCAMAAMTSIYQLVTTGNEKMSNINASNLREVVGQAASLKLNANAVPRECYFQLRSKQIDGKWQKVVEMGIEGDGFDSMLRQFGNGIKKVYPVWLVKEGDEFTYPKRKGIEVEAPTWEAKGLSEKVKRVVYPIMLADGTVDYLIAERDSVRVNLMAHIRNNMMNETFGIVTGTKRDKYNKEVERTRYDATPEEKRQIKEKKNEILEAVRKCTTIEEILDCEIARPFISAAWLDTPESMIARKLRNNAIKKYPKNFDSMANQSFIQMDDAYKASREEIEEHENSEEFVVEGEATIVDEPDFVGAGE